MKFSDAFTSSSISLNWNTFQQTSNRPPLLGTSFFPPKKKLGLDLKFIKGYSGAPIALAASAFDTEATVRDRIGFKVLQDSMPYFKESFLVKEEDRQEILRAQDSNDPYVQTVIDSVYADARNLIDGANVIPERMIWQLLAPVDGTPKISISDNGVNKEYNYDPDGSFKANNFRALSGTSAWTDYENSDPIADIESGAEKIAKATGVRPTYAIMSQKTLNDIKKNKNVKGYIISSANGGVARITKQAVIDLIQSETKITVIEYNAVFKPSQNAPAQSYYPDDMVTLLPANVGNMYYGTTPNEADKMSGSNADTTIVNTGVAVTVIQKTDPVQSQTIASEICLPSFEGMDTVFVINTDSNAGKLTVTSTAGTATGKTAVTVTPSAASGNSYKYKAGASITIPKVGDVCSSGYTNWDGSAEITAVTGNTIVIVEVDSNNKAVKVGSATVTSKS